MPHLARTPTTFGLRRQEVLATTVRMISSTLIREMVMEMEVVESCLCEGGMFLNLRRSDHRVTLLRSHRFC